MTMLKDAIRAADAERKQQENPAEVIESSKARDTESSKTVNTESSKTVQDEEVASVEIAALTIKVPKAHRVHWLIEAKKQNTTLTAAITEALNARFGKAQNEP